MRDNITLFLRAILVSLLVILFDQWSKCIAVGVIAQEITHSIKVFPFFNLVIVYNKGVSFGILNELTYGRFILSAVAISIVICLIIWLFREKNNKLIAYSLSLIIGGAIGNTIDRFRIGSVVDFLDFHLFGYHWPAFNIADSAVFVGVVLMIIDGLFMKKDVSYEK